MDRSLVITARRCGFFSNYMHIVDNLKYCNDNGYKPIMDLSNRSGGNANYPQQYMGWIYDAEWNYYFKPLSDNIPIGSVEYSCFFKIDNFIMINGYDDGLNKGNIWELRYQGGREDEIERIRNDAYVVIKKYIALSDSIANVVDKFEKDNFCGKMLGVHVRGTDYGFHDLNKYMEAIDNILLNYDKIYLATDNNETIDKMKQIYKDKVCYYETNLRSEKFIDKVVIFNEGVVRNLDDKYKQGQDVLVEATLLSKCDHLICISSGVALSVLLMNPYMSFDLIGRPQNGG